MTRLVSDYLNSDPFPLAQRRNRLRNSQPFWCKAPVDPEGLLIIFLEVLGLKTIFL